MSALVRFLSSERTSLEFADPWVGAVIGSEAGVAGGTFS